MMSLPFRIAAVAASAVLAGPVHAQSDETARLADVSARGELIAAYDRIAWLGADDLRTRLTDWQTRVGGWIVDGPRDAPTIVFYNGGTTPRALYTARLVDNRLVDATLPEGSSATLSPDRLHLVAARDAASRAMTAARITPCSTSFNTVVLPAETTGGPIRVYFLSALTKIDDVVVGGHYRVEVDATGHAGAPFAFSKACMTMKRPPGDARSAMLTVTTLTDTIPNETHVFTARSYNLPLIVGVPGKRVSVFAVIPGRQVREVPVKP